MNDPILRVSQLSMHFGGVRAVDSLDIEVSAGEIVAIIGPNGAGKTTFFNCLTGIYRPTKGDIFLQPPNSSGQEIRLNGRKINKITELGMARTFQTIRLFPKMSCLENVMIGRHCRTRSFIFGAVFRNKATLEEEQESIDFSYRIIQKVGIEPYVNELAENLPYGIQRRLEIARALATEPFLLLLDEPAAGLNPHETKELDDLIVTIKEEGLGILLIEHDMKLVMSLSDRICVMDYGKKISQGTPEEVSGDPEVIKAYLGVE